MAISTRVRYEYFIARCDAETASSLPSAAARHWRRGPHAQFARGKCQGVGSIGDVVPGVPTGQICPQYHGVTTRLRRLKRRHELHRQPGRGAIVVHAVVTSVAG